MNKKKIKNNRSFYFFISCIFILIVFICFLQAYISYMIDKSSHINKLSELNENVSFIEECPKKTENNDENLSFSCLVAVYYDVGPYYEKTYEFKDECYYVVK